MPRSLATAALLGALLGLVAAVAPAGAQERPWLDLFTAGQGSAFLPYGQGLARHLEEAGAATVAVKESKGSNENLAMVDAAPTALGTAFLGSASDAVNGTGWAQGKPHANVRALFPMYETSFQVAALASKGIGSIKDLDGKRVGVGPAAGPAEVFFRALAEEAKIKPTIINGAPAELARQAIAGEIDALWQGAIVPIPSLVQVANGSEAVVFGLSEAEVAALTRRLPFLAAASVPAGTYKGQAGPIRSVAAWNFVIAHKDLPDAQAYAIAKAALTVADPAARIHPFAAGTRAANAPSNRVVPFHPGAARYLAEAGIALPSR